MRASHYYLKYYLIYIKSYHEINFLQLIFLEHILDNKLPKSLLFVLNKQITICWYLKAWLSLAFLTSSRIMNKLTFFSIYRKIQKYQPFYRKLWAATLFHKLDSYSQLQLHLMLSGLLSLNQHYRCYFYTYHEKGKIPKSGLDKAYIMH